MVVQLTIPFSPIEEEPQRKDGRKVIWEFMGITMLEPTSRAGENPCTKCWANGICDSDECGRKLFPIDLNEVY